VGTTGGTVTTPNGAASVNLPAGAVPNGTTIQIVPISTGALPPAGFTASTSVYEFSDFGPGGALLTSFSTPVQITFSYTGTPPTEVAFFNGNTWEAVPTTVNPTAQTVTGTTNHFTPFAAFTPTTNLTVRLTPSGTQSLANGPFQVQAVDLRLNPVAAPADITVTLRRNVISPCRNLLFSSLRTVTISAGQTVGGALDAAGADPTCIPPGQPITTQWTVCQAIEAPSTVLDLGLDPAAAAQLSVAIVRGSLTGAPAPIPHACGAILENGNDITASTQSVVVGQQITLGGQITPCTLAASPTWAGLADTVGGALNVTYSSTPDPVTGLFDALSAAITPTNTNQSTTTFYFVTPALGQRVTYTDPGCGVGSATVTFDVIAPSLNVTAPTGLVSVDPVGLFIYFGCRINTQICPAGVNFQANDSTNPNLGLNITPIQFEWVQLVDQDTVDVTRRSDGAVGVCAPPSFSGLDNQFPYAGFVDRTADSPSLGFSQTANTDLVRNFRARMYLMWTPTISGATTIAVPLGSVSWSARGEATFTANQWGAPNPTQPPVNIISLSQNWTPSSSGAPAHGYPTWTAIVKNNSVFCPAGFGL